MSARAGDRPSSVATLVTRRDGGGRRAVSASLPGRVLGLGSSPNGAKRVPAARG
jgi:hypothetical protein